MKKALAFLILLSPMLAETDSSGAETSWLCTEEASQRLENSIMSCGIGTGKDENQARLNAFDQAKNEFNKICDTSVDCRKHEISAEPRRTTCQQDGKGFKCYRLVAFYIAKAQVSSKDASASNFKTMNGNTKLTRGMSKKDLVAKFGTPISIGDLGTQKKLYGYSGEMCNYEGQLCFVRVKNGKVQSWSDFKVIYSQDN